VSIGRSVTVLAAAAILAVGVPTSVRAEEASAPVGAPAAAEASLGEHVVSIALTMVGAPYRWGGVTPAGFDCSGFVLWAFSHFGFALPHSETGQLRAGTQVGAEALEPGDIVVFRNTYRVGPSHSGIYVGGGQFVHAVDYGKGVMVSNIWDGYWGPRFVAGVRLEA
jgi:cell wall-associated NlpC family hydrolase